MILFVFYTFAKNKIALVVSGEMC